MEDDVGAPPLRLVNFISEDQLDHAKKARGLRVEDGTAQRDRPLYEILKENKDKKDAEFNERFKHRPPKALDEDETEFLDNLEMTKREYERQIANEEALELRSFQEAVAAQTNIVHELKETRMVSRPEEQKPVLKRNTNARPGNLIISVKSQPKKAKTDVVLDKSSEPAKPASGHDNKPSETALGSLVSYGDDSEDED
ncbi:FAM192A/Fyv6 N-terminal protein [Dioscorea alata]|uniref:FAM192A/Fyv6 N-terminal protein n=1 Tax=Dioscorea alata TaxID=55571 RepID=A0ACB7VVC3_DIOAL|nr:FAM192A/Fyv6 N-terminal protein [Dioscorea alata]